MSKKISITLDNEILDFVDQLASNRSSFINEILWKEKKRISMQKLENAYREQDQDTDFQEEFAVWDITVGDGLNA
jgi:metal-responsive CopG/Arc/MetJ family transcriptional regulator